MFIYNGPVGDAVYNPSDDFMKKVIFETDASHREFSISINIPELVDAVVTEYSLYENGNGRKCFDMNWGG